MAHVVRTLALLLVAVIFSSGMACGPAPRAPRAPVAIAVAPEAPAIPLPPPTYADPQWQRGSGPPLTLTASDGTGLTLTALTARAVVNAPLAFTELAVTFDNPRDRTIEG